MVGFEELLVVVRSEEGGQLKSDDHRSNAAATTPLAEWAGVAKAEHRIEECLKRGPGEAGLGDDPVRNWLGWHHHRTLSWIASWFLVKEADRGNNAGAGVDGAAGPTGVGADLPQGPWARCGGAEQPRADCGGGRGTSGRGCTTTSHVIRYHT